MVTEAAPKATAMDLRIHKKVLSELLAIGTWMTIP
jgi:hypothetical protein